MANQNQPKQPAPQQGQGHQGQQGFSNQKHQQLHAEAQKYGITVPDWLQNLINEYGDQAAAFVGTMILRILASFKTQANLKQGMQSQPTQACPQHLKEHLEAAHEAALAAAIETACACCHAGCDVPDCNDDPCDRP
jgi:uncharacterized membrane protein